VSYTVSRLPIFIQSGISQLIIDENRQHRGNNRDLLTLCATSSTSSFTLWAISSTLCWTTCASCTNLSLNVVFVSLVSESDSLPCKKRKHVYGKCKFGLDWCQSLLTIWRQLTMGPYFSHSCLESKTIHRCIETHNPFRFRRKLSMI